MPFTAKARIPVRPLSYKSVDLSVNKELIIDYETGEVYVKKENGDIVGITSSILKELTELIKKDPTLGNNITITITRPNPDTGEMEETIVNLNEQIIQMLLDIDAIKKQLEKLGIIIDESGNIIINISADNIVETDKKQFVSKTDKTAWNDASKVFMLFATVKGGAANWSGTKAPFTQKVLISEMKETWYPIIDIKLPDDYDQAQKDLENYSCLYRVTTHNGYILCYANKVPEANFNINIKCDKNVRDDYPVTT